jgi:hypothetical protein
MIRVAFDVNDFSGLCVRAADETAGDRTIVTKREGLFCAPHFVDLFHFIGIGDDGTQVDPKG